MFRGCKLENLVILCAGFEFRVLNFGFWFLSSVFESWDLEGNLVVHRAGFGIRVSDFGFRIKSFGFLVVSSEFVSGFGFRVKSLVSTLRTTLSYTVPSTSNFARGSAFLITISTLSGFGVRVLRILNVGSKFLGFSVSLSLVQGLGFRESISSLSTWNLACKVEGLGCKSARGSALLIASPTLRSGISISG